MHVVNSLGGEERLVVTQVGRQFVMFVDARIKCWVDGQLSLKLAMRAGARRRLMHHAAKLGDTVPGWRHVGRRRLGDAIVRQATHLNT